MNVSEFYELATRIYKEFPPDHLVVFPSSAGYYKELLDARVISPTTKVYRTAKMYEQTKSTELLDTFMEEHMDSIKKKKLPAWGKKVNLTIYDDPLF